MAKETAIKLTGFEVLGNLFDSLPRDIAGKVGVAALRKGAKPILEEAKNLVPVNKGKLKESLAIQTIRGDVPAVTIVARRRKPFRGFYAHLVEFGTKPHEIKNVLIGGKFFPVIQHPGSVARPFMRPAFLTKKNEALKIILESISGEIEKKIEKAMKL